MFLRFRANSPLWGFEKKGALADKPEWLPAPSVVIDPANGVSFRAFGMEICEAPVGELLFEENWIREKSRKVIGTMTKTIAAIRSH